MVRNPRSRLSRGAAAGLQRPGEKNTFLPGGFKKDWTLKGLRGGQQGEAGEKNTLFIGVKGLEIERVLAE